MNKFVALLLTIFGAASGYVALVGTLLIERLTFSMSAVLGFGAALLASATGVYLYRHWGYLLAPWLCRGAILIGVLVAVRLGVELSRHRPPVAVLFGYISPDLETIPLLGADGLFVFSFACLAIFLQRIRSRYPNECEQFLGRNRGTHK